MLLASNVSKVLLVLAAALALVTGTAGATDKPNIILILSDDFGYGDSAPTAAARDAACPRPASTAWRTRA